MIGFGFACDWLRSGGTSFINQSKSKVKSTNKTIPDYFQDSIKTCSINQKKKKFLSFFSSRYMKVKTNGSGEEKGVKSALPLKFDPLGMDAIPHGTYHNLTYANRIIKQYM